MLPKGSNFATVSVVATREPAIELVGNKVAPAIVLRPMQPHGRARSEVDNPQGLRVYAAHNYHSAEASREQRGANL
jgi:hypothetical protein